LKPGTRLENAAHTPSRLHVVDCRDSDARSGAVLGGVFFEVVYLMQSILSNLLEILHELDHDQIFLDLKPVAGGGSTFFV